MTYIQFIFNIHLEHIDSSISPCTIIKKNPDADILVLGGDIR